MSDVHFNCPACSQSLVVEETGCGLIIDCPLCERPVQVPPKKLIARIAPKPEAMTLLESEVSNLKSQLESTRSELAAALSIPKEDPRDREEIARLEVAMETLAKEKQSLQETLSKENKFKSEKAPKRSEAVVQNQDAVAALQVVSDQADGLRREKEELQKQLEICQDEIVLLKKNLTEQQKASDTRDADWEKEIAKLQNALTAARKDYESTGAEAQQETARLRKQTEDLSRDLDSAKAEVKKGREALQQVEEKHDILLKGHEALKKIAVQREGELKTVTGDRDRQRQELSHAKTELARALHDLKTAQGHRELFDRDFERAKNDLLLAKKEIQKGVETGIELKEVRRQMLNIQHSLESSRERETALRQELAQSRQTIDNLSETSLKKDNDVLRGIVARMNEEQKRQELVRELTVVEEKRLTFRSKNFWPWVLGLGGLALLELAGLIWALIALFGK